jgi:hypothetical protein
MQLYRLEDIENDPSYCYVDSALPCNAELAEGLPAKPSLERLGIDTLALTMDEDEGGLKLADYISNTDLQLPLREACARAIIAEFNVGEHELLAAKLVNEKGRVHAEDYVVLNPLGQIDCLDQAASDMDEDEDDPSVQVMGRFTLSRDKVPAGRDLFRVKGLDAYIFSERLVKFIQLEGFSNFVFEPVQVG